MKNQKIRESLRATRLKRKSQKCRVFELKLDYSSLSKSQKETLKMFFIEGKWLYNHILSQEDIFKFDTKTKIVQVKTKNRIFEDRNLTFLPAWSRQFIFHQIKRSIFTLATKKKRGMVVGRLRFKSSFNVIDFSSLKFFKNTVKIPLIKKRIKVYGLHQLKDYELANAKLIRKASGYFIKVTTYEFIKPEENNYSNLEVGIDFGIKNTLTTSDGEIFNFKIEETERLKKLQRQFARSKKGSNNRWKLRMKIRKEYEKISNQKNDQSNKIVNYLQTKYRYIYIQDENLRGWHSGLFGKQVQFSCLGRIKAKLKSSKNTFVIDRFLPTTKVCYQCGKRNNIGWNPIYECECGLKEDRDIKAAKTILQFGKRSDLVPVESRDFKLVEKQTTAF